MTDVYEKINVGLSEEESIGLPQTADNLTKIKGIGSGTAEKLNVRKIYTYRQLAEITPEKLSEAPGIGIATARKIIEEAKKLLGGIKEDNTVKLPEPSKEEPIIAQKTKEEAIVLEEIELETAETEYKEDFELDEPIQQRKVTPYEKLLARSDDKTENPILELEEIETEIEFEKEERQEEYQGYREEVLEKSENNLTVEPSESEASVPVEEIPREKDFNTPVYTELPEVPEIPEVTEILETSEVPTILRTINPREELANEVAESLKNLGYYAIPSGIEALAPFFQKVDCIGLKLVPVNGNSKLIFLVPIKLCDLEGTLLVHEEKIDYKAYSKAQESESDLASTARHHADELLRVKDAMFEEVVNGDGFRNFVEKYLQVRFAAEKSAKNKKLYFISGQTQFKVLIEPILLARIPAKCMEKSILYPYQRKTNLHVIGRSKIGHLLRFLEKKYKLIESRAKKTNSIETYQNSDAKFRSSLRVASLPFLGYSVVLLVIYFSQLYFLLRLFNSIGIAAIGIYSLAIAYFYFKFYETKKELKTEFETPYYLQDLEFSETDLLCVKEELTDEQMAQFGYECFGKDNDSAVLKKIEKEAIKESVVAKQREQDAPQLFELDSDREYNSIREEPKNEIKYSSFLED